jgi:PucR C-terminal helix-turn-helix domain
MTSLLDVWRAIDPEARLVSGSVERLTRPVRGVLRSRATSPHLPDAVDGELLILDAGLAPGGHLDQLLSAMSEAGLDPSGLVLAGEVRPAEVERSSADLPVLASLSSTATVADAAAAYLEGESAFLTDLSVSLRLAGAEAALADPRPSAPAGVVAERLRRGVAVAVDGRLTALHARPAGRALAGRFSAAFARMLVAGSGHDGAARRTRDGLWLLQRGVGPGAAVWLFDDMPFARSDEVALDALTVTLRALLRRTTVAAPSALPPVRRQPPSTGDALRDTLLAVARANGRVATAARSLGVHRNTVLYRLRRARVEQGIDPRRPEDALRLLQQVEEARA